MSLWCPTCPVCLRPVGRARHCPYCDEPLLMPTAGRKLWQLVVLLALAGALTVSVAPTGWQAALHGWPTGTRWLVLAVLVGAVSGLCHGVPLPVLLFAAEVPALPRAAALGAYAAASAVRLREVADDPTALPFADGGGPLPSTAAIAAAGAGWALVAVAALQPAVCVSVATLLRAHGGWLLVAGLLAVALLSPSGAAVPPHDRLERLRDQWSSTVGALAFLTVAVLAGVRLLRQAPAEAAAAAAGMFTVAPLLWRTISGTTGVPTDDTTPRRRGTPLAAALRATLLAVLAIGAVTTAGDPLPPLLLFAGAATFAALLRSALPIRSAGALAARFGWVPAALVVLWIVASGGLQGIGILSLAAALTLWASLRGLPSALSLGLWAPLIR